MSQISSSKPGPDASLPQPDPEPKPQPEVGSLTRKNQVVDDFVAVLEQNPGLRIDEFLEHHAEFSVAERAELFKELLFLVLSKRAQNETIVRKEYLDRYPAYAQQVGEVFDEFPGLKKLRHFQIRRLLGEGSFGTVYLAWDEHLEKEVALKVPRPGARIAQMAVEDARKAAKLNHPGIVTVHYLEQEHDGACFIVMQYIEGRSLDEVLKKSGRLTVSSGSSLMAEVAEAVHHAHEKGVIHRDLKPANILIDSAGKPHVADFGLAVLDSERRRMGNKEGTPAYMAPEQVRGEPYFSNQTDVWSLGVILYEVLTGQKPFSAANIQELFEQIQNRPLKSPCLIDPDIPQELDRICRKCLEKSQDARYTTAAELARDLRRLRLNGIRRRAPWIALLIGFIIISVLLSLLVHSLHRQSQRKKWTFAIGASFAMLGQSSGEVGQPVLEVALGNLGFPEQQRNQLCQRYAELEKAVQAKELNYDEFQETKARLFGKTQAQLETLLGEKYRPYIDLGHDMSRFLLLLRFWEQLRSDGDVLATAEACLASLQKSVDGVSLPAALRDRIRHLQASELEEPEVREDIIRTLMQALGSFDLQPF